MTANREIAAELRRLVEDWTTGSPSGLPRSPSVAGDWILKRATRLEEDSPPATIGPDYDGEEPPGGSVLETTGGAGTVWYRISGWWSTGSNEPHSWRMVQQRLSEDEHPWRVVRWGQP